MLTIIHFIGNSYNLPFPYLLSDNARDLSADRLGNLIARDPTLDLGSVEDIQLTRVIYNAAKGDHTVDIGIQINKNALDLGGVEDRYRSVTVRIAEDKGDLSRTC